MKEEEEDLAESGSSTSFSTAAAAANLPSPSPSPRKPDAVVKAPPGLKLDDGASGRMVVIRHGIVMSQ